MELEILDPLFSTPRYFDIAVAIFHWLIPKVLDQLKVNYPSIQLEVVRVEYLGAYPAIGIHYEDPQNTPDLETEISVIIERLLRERPVMELVHYISESNLDWKEITAYIMRED